MPTLTPNWLASSLSPGSAMPDLMPFFCTNRISSSLIIR
ncbi:Uncharacterised protein [Bordetella pertussis]|nr:Uncharacterised protein [Bordetella pertussis]CPL64307.1 Uncharacterised protein [Bordetella pertussis]